MLEGRSFVPSVAREQPVVVTVGAFACVAVRARVDAALGRLRDREDVTCGERSAPFLQESQEKRSPIAK